MSAHPNSNEQHDGDLPSYLSRLTQAPLLSFEEEIVLTRAALAGDLHSKQRLIESNMRLVINIARAYQSRLVPLEDLIQEGAIGLIQATERFDPDKGFRFSTYATHWIRQCISRAIDNKAKAIRLPAHVSQSLRRIERERQRLLRELGKDPTNDQIALAMGISVNKLNLIIESSRELLSLDMAVGERSVTLGSLLPDENAPDPEQQLISQEMMEEVQVIFQELTEREQRVMHMRFRNDGMPPPRHDDLAQELKLSRERVRQIEIQAIKKLRALANRRRLREMMN